MSELLRVKHLAKSFGGVAAVVDVSFALEAGELLALIGPNGAGKSTCFNLLNGQLSPDSGRIFLGADEITFLPPRRIWRLGVGRTFQVTQSYASMSVIENVQVALLAHHRRLFGLWPRAAELYVEEAIELLRIVGMEEQAWRRCGILAYGDLKRVELAVALANQPKLLLMDEPTAGMAAHERGALMALTEEIVRERRIGVLFTEHDMDVVFGHADRVIVLDRGRVIAAGPPAAVRDDPAVREVYLGSRNPRAPLSVLRDAAVSGSSE
jgi:branched-chain amino acid transport system ATP-binding protein